MMLSLPHPAKVIEKSAKNNFAQFEIEALYPGYGVTLGNTLRRVLYSSLPGAAITQVKIKGVSHEFSALPGVLEDVLQITLNLKQVRLISHSSEPQTGRIKVKGKKEVKAGALEFSGKQVEVANPELGLATLTSKQAELDMEVVVEKGLGYVPVEARKTKSRLEIGQIPIDAIFSPIRRVSFKVENMRVGERTDFDRLLLGIETDGTISPEEAFLQACEIAASHFQIVAEPFKKKEPEKKEIVKKAKAIKKLAKKIRAAKKKAKKK